MPRVTGICERNSPHKRPVTRKVFAFDDVIIIVSHAYCHGTHARFQIVSNNCVNTFGRIMIEVKGNISYPYVYIWTIDCREVTRQFLVKKFSTHIYHTRRWQCKGELNHQIHMMTSSNRNIFRSTGPLCGEFTGDRWIPRTKASSLICVWMNDWVNNRKAGELRRHRGRCDVTVMTY